MRDLASGSGSGPGEQPLPPTVTQRSAVDGRQPQEEGPILPPFFPSASPRIAASVEVIAAAASAPSSSGDVSEDDFWDTLDDGDDTPVSVSSFAPEPGAENFPMDAFFIPEGADHVPAGVDPDAAQHTEHRVDLDPAWIAERLEMVARRLRREGDASLVTMRASGDELDNRIADLLADYLATRKP
jgi:hypothetical protein